MYFQILLCASSERRLSLLTLPLIASLRLPPEPHKATNRILSSTQTRTPSLHCCWLFLPRMRVSAADYTSWHSWLAWAYGSDSALTDLERKPQGLDEISRWSKIRVDLHYLVFKFNCFVQCQLFIMFRFPWKYEISRWNNTTYSQRKLALNSSEVSNRKRTRKLKLSSSVISQSGNSCAFSQTAQGKVDQCQYLAGFFQDTNFNLKPFHSQDFKINSPYLHTILYIHFLQRKFWKLCCLGWADFQDFPGTVIIFQS